ncbi:MAG TPA: dATP pyrophosphohydrolase [Hansschlegelia sp.]
MTTFEIRPVESKADLEAFIALPDRLHAGDPNYIAPLRMERRDALSRKKNPAFNYMDAAFWMAWRDGRPVGRISAQADRRTGDIGHFGLIAAEDDPEIFHALFGEVERFHRARGKAEIQGPFSLNINEESGLLIDGFDTPSMMLMPHDLPYVGPRVEAQGYAKTMDLYAYLHDTGTPFPKSIQRIFARPKPPELVIRHIDWKRYDDELPSIIGIFNDAWADNWGFVPFGEDELRHVAKSMKLLLDERLVWIAEVAGRPAAFGLALPNLNEMIRDLDGELLPFGWAKLLWRLKRQTYTSARIPLMGVRREFHGTYLGNVMPFYIFEKFREEGWRRKVRHVEMSWVLETNKPMRHIGEALSGGEAYKTYRIYSKRLTS